MERHGEDTGRTLSAWRRFAPTVPVWGFIFDGLFFHSDSTLYFNSFFPVTMISTDCSSCSALSVSLPNVVQRQPLSVAIQAHYSVKIAGPENDVYMYEFICPESVQKQSPRTLSDPTMVTQRLAALRSHGSRFWGFWEAIKPPFGC